MTSTYFTYFNPGKVALKTIFPFFGFLYLRQGDTWWTVFVTTIFIIWGFTNSSWEKINKTHFCGQFWELNFFGMHCQFKFYFLGCNGWDVLTFIWSLSLLLFKYAVLGASGWELREWRKCTHTELHRLGSTGSPVKIVMIMMILTIMLFFIKWVTCENSADDNDNLDGDNILWSTWSIRSVDFMTDMLVNNMIRINRRKSWQS